MSYTNGSEIVDAIVKLSEGNKIALFQKRRQKNRVLEGFVQDTELTVPKTFIEAARTSPVRPIRIPYLKKFSPTITGVRACDPTAPTTESAEISPTWTTKVFNVALTPSEMTNSNISAAELLAHQLEGGFLTVFEDIEADAAAYLEANKTLAVDLESEFMYTFAAGNYDVPQADRLTLYRDMQPTLEANNIHDFPVRDFHNITASSMINQLRENSTFNAQNNNLPLDSDLYMFHGSKSIVNDVAAEQTHYFVPQGSLAVLQWTDLDSQMGNRIHESNYWTTMIDPIFGWRWGVKYLGECFDNSAVIAGTQATMVKKWQISIDISYMSAVPDAAGETPIYKVEVAK